MSEALELIQVDRPSCGRQVRVQARVIRLWTIESNPFMNVWFEQLDSVRVSVWNVTAQQGMWMPTPHLRVHVERQRYGGPVEAEFLVPVRLWVRICRELWQGLWEESTEHGRCT